MNFRRFYIKLFADFANEIVSVDLMAGNHGFLMLGSHLLVKTGLVEVVTTLKDNNWDIVRRFKPQGRAGI